MTKDIYTIHYRKPYYHEHGGEPTIEWVSETIDGLGKAENFIRIVKLNYQQYGEIKVVKGTRPLTEQELKEVAFQNMGRELANLKLESMEKDNAITKLGEELSNEKLQRMIDNSTNLKLEDEIEKLRKEIQNFNRGE